MLHKQTGFYEINIERNFSFCFFLVYAKKCHALWIKEEKMNSDTRFDWGRIIRNKCIMAGRRLERRLRKK